MVDVLEGVWFIWVSGGCVRRRECGSVGSVVDVLEEGLWLSGVSGGCVRRRSGAQWAQWWMC